MRACTATLARLNLGMVIAVRSRLEFFVDQLISSESHDAIEGVWKFENGAHCGVCTNGAMLVAARFNGDVWGYQSAENPTATIGEPYCSGHDFTVIRQRWLIDYWAYRVSRLSHRSVLDLKHTQDGHLATCLYGNPDNWARIASFEAVNRRRELRGGMSQTRGWVQQASQAIE